MGWWLTELSFTEVLHKVRHRLVPNLRYLYRSQVRTCEACQRATLFLALGADEEFRVCLRCRANARYEALAAHLRHGLPNLSSLDVLELDFSSPLRTILGGARSYTRSFYRPDVEPGTVREDGVVCQDITRLTFADESLDLIVSSDVLEHVPDAERAFRETARVLRPGGAHVFTVPPRVVTRRRALLENGQLRHLVEPPEYHRDPLDRSGVLTFWDYGPDLADKFPTAGLQIRALPVAHSESGRVVWEARKCG